jgi:hypothetical protein
VEEQRVDLDEPPPPPAAFIQPTTLISAYPHDSYSNSLQYGHQNIARSSSATHVGQVTKSLGEFGTQPWPRAGDLVVQNGGHGALHRSVSDAGFNDGPPAYGPHTEYR